MKNRSYKQRKRQKLRRHQIDDLLVDHTSIDLPNHKQENTSSIKNFFCVACNKSFNQFKSKNDFISGHISKNSKCKNGVFICINCNNIFLTESALDKHYNNTTQCKLKLIQSKSHQRFCVSEVMIAAQVPDSNPINSSIGSSDGIPVGKSSIYFAHHSTMAKQKSDNKISAINLQHKVVKPFDPNLNPDSDSAPSVSKTSTSEDKVTSYADDSSVSDRDGDNDSFLTSCYNNLDDDNLNIDDDVSDSCDEILLNEFSMNNDKCIVIGENMTITNGGSNTMNENITQTVSVFQIGNASNVTIGHDHLLDMWSRQQEEMPSPYVDKEYSEAISLVKVLLKKNIPLSAYKDFMKWKHDSFSHHQGLSLKSLMESATHRVYGKSLGDALKPTVHTLSLPSGRKASVVKFNFDALLFDLLSDKDLMKQENLIFDTSNMEDPFICRESPFYGDFENTEYYKETSKMYNINSKDSVLCPLLFYLDELKIDAFGRLGLEPLVFTLLIYNRKTRNLNKAWRNLGYMPNFDSLFGNTSYTPEEKANDYHACLKFLMSDVVLFQNQSTGITWDFRLHYNSEEKVFRRNLYIPIGYIIGDAKGNDILCGRYGSRKSTCVARDCNVTTDQCDEPSHCCKFHLMSDLLSLNETQLHELSFRKLKVNAFAEMAFGHQPYGINGCTPPEPLHQFLLGIVERLPKSFFQRLSGNMVVLLDRHVGYICSKFAAQSDRSMPYIGTFAHGVSEAKKLSAKEKLARVFVIYLVLLTSDFREQVVDQNGRKVKNEDGSFKKTTKIDKKEYARWLQAFEETLLLYAWITLENHVKVFFKGGSKSIVAKRLEQFMAMYKKNAPRTQGMKLKLLKFHQIKHLWWVIRLYGSLLNVDSGIGESNNKTKKAAGKATQRRRLILDLQTSVESYKRDLFLRAISILYPDIESGRNNVAEDKSNTSQVLQECNCRDLSTANSEQKCHGSKYKLSFDYIKKEVEASWIGYKMKNCSTKFPKFVLDSVYNKLSHYNGGVVGRRITSVAGFTEYSTTTSLEKPVSKEPYEEKIVFRACPNYRGEKDWFDWAVVKWEENDTTDPFSFLEAQILLFVDFTTIEYEHQTTGNNDHQHDTIDYDTGAFIHSVNKNVPRSFFSGYCSKIAHQAKMEDVYQLVNIHSITDTAFVLIDKTREGYDSRKPGTSSDVIVLTERNQWAKEFIDYDDNTLKEEASKISNNEIPANSKRFPYEG